MTIAVVTVVVVTFFSKDNLTPPKPMRFLRAAFRDLAMFFVGGSNYYNFFLFSLRGFNIFVGGGGHYIYLYIFCTVLHCTALHCIALYRTVHCIKTTLP